MEIRDLKELQIDSIHSEPEWVTYPGTKFQLKLSELAPEDWDRINKQATGRAFDKKSRTYIDKTNSKKLQKLIYESSIHDCRGLTPRIIHETLKLKWTVSFPEDEEIQFANAEVMHGFLIQVGLASSRLNRMISNYVIPDPETVSDDEEAFETEKKIS